MFDGSLGAFCQLWAVLLTFVLLGYSTLLMELGLSQGGRIRLPFQKLKQRAERRRLPARWVGEFEFDRAIDAYEALIDAALIDAVLIDAAWPDRLLKSS